MSTDLENQVIGRAQRMGRENPLVINYQEECYYRKQKFKVNCHLI